MKIDPKKTSHILFFGSIGWISFQIGYLIDKNFNVPFWLEGFSPVAIFSTFYMFFDQYLWRWRVWRLFGIVDFPNISGRWKGSHRSSYKENRQNVVTEAVMEIKQTFSSIHINCYYPKSDSWSVVATFHKHNGDQYLYYVYDNNPNSLKTGSMAMQKGTAKLKFLEKRKKLVGTYYNSIGNDGDIDMTYEGDDLKGEK